MRKKALLRTIAFTVFILLNSFTCFSQNYQDYIGYMTFTPQHSGPYSSNQEVWMTGTIIDIDPDHGPLGQLKFYNANWQEISVPYYFSGYSFNFNIDPAMTPIHVTYNDQVEYPNYTYHSCYADGYLFLPVSYNIYQLSGRECGDGIARVELEIENYVNSSYESLQLFELPVGATQYNLISTHSPSTYNFLEIPSYNPQSQYAVKLTYAEGYSETDFYPIAVDVSQPVALTISGPSSFIIGEEPFFTAQSTSTESYLWRVNGNDYNSGNGPFQIPSGLSAGTYTLEVRILTASGCVYPPVSTSFTAFGSVSTSNMSYIRTWEVIKPINDIDLIKNSDSEKARQSVQYFDGLGRPLQHIQIQGSPQKKDILQPIVYDPGGREAVKYQPYTVANNSGAYRQFAIAEQGTFYNSPPDGIKATPSPFSVTVYEPSPLNKVVEQGFPGNVWQPFSPLVVNSGHTIKMGYDTNIANEVKLWTINTTDNGAVSSSYGAGKLFKNIVKDENWKPVDAKAGTTEEFRDVDGRVVLKRVWENDSRNLDTYYVYDDFGNLRYVLPPAVNENGAALISGFDESLSVFNQFIYGYHYDGRKRVIEKKIPGKGWEFMVYNKLNHVVMNQDAMQRAKSPQEWNFSKYDAFGRMVMSGRYIDDLHNGQADMNYRSSFQEIADGTAAYEKRDPSNAVTGYSNNAIPQGGIGDYYVLSYYDDYDFPGNSFGQPSNTQAPKERTRSLLTGTKTKVLGTGQTLLSVNYYDLDGRVVQAKENNHLGGTDIINNTYSFAGELTASTRTHVVSGVKTFIANRFEYDHMGRKGGTYMSINNKDEVALNKYEYNDFGQLKSKKLHGTYAGQGALKQSEILGDADIVHAGQSRIVMASGSITLRDGFEAKEGSFFSAKITDGTFLQQTEFTYNERGWLRNSTSNEFSMALKYDDGPIPQYNSNISTQAYTNGTSNTFNYTYDKLNRLTISAAGNNLGETISYDAMGNISSLTRDGFGTNSYSGYDGNRLTAISGFTNSSYGYDANGNLLSDSQKGISVSYNYLNLPKTVSGTQNMAYTYSASGEKLKKQNGTTGIITDYVGGIQYNNGAIEFILTEEGLARRKSDGNYSYEYTLNDYLGNARYSFDVYNDGVRKIQQQDYYAFGLVKESGQYVFGEKNKYLYNGKELQEELGQLDYGARFYDPVLGRWNVVDKKAELYFQITPYAYAANTPTNAIDPDGHLVIFINGNYTDGSGGTRRYWQKSHRENIPGEDWRRNVVDQDFAGAVMNRLGDHNARYVDGGGGFFKGNHPVMTLLFPGFSGIGPEDRRGAGYRQGMDEAAAVIKSLHRTNGVIDESIKVISHSMGGAYSKGYIQAIIDYAKLHEIAGVNFAFEADFAPFQPTQQTAIEGVGTLQFSHNNDKVAGKGKMPGAEQIDTSSDKIQLHSIFGFMDQIKNLPVGKYQVVNGKIVPDN